MMISKPAASVKEGLSGRELEPSGQSRLHIIIRSPLGPPWLATPPASIPEARHPSMVTQGLDPPHASQPCCCTTPIHSLTPGHDDEEDGGDEYSSCEGVRPLLPPQPDPLGPSHGPSPAQKACLWHKLGHCTRKRQSAAQEEGAGEPTSQPPKRGTMRLTQRTRVDSRAV